MNPLRLALVLGTILAAGLAACGRSDLDADGPRDGGGDGPACPAPRQLCGGACVDTRTDRAHCGGCNVTCPRALVCSGGSCVASCGAGETDCGGTCVDTQTDAQNCGACGKRCKVDEACLFGACTLTCPVGLTKCGSTCVDLQKDPKNCGLCGVACAGGETCQSGVCCGGGKTVCGGACVDTQTDPKNCGACGAVCDGGVCAMGKCASACKKTVLLVTDNDAQGNAALTAVLQAAGFTVTQTSVVTYAGTPAASGFGAVLVTNGEQWSQDMAPGGQLAIVAAQGAGVGVVLTEWAAYMALTNRWQTLGALNLLARPNINSGTTAQLAFTLTSPNHPVWTGLPTSFTTGTTMGASTQMTATNGGTVIASCAQCMGAGVAVKDPMGQGRIVHMVHAANYGVGHPWGDANLAKLMVNATSWAARCD